MHLLVTFPACEIAAFWQRSTLFEFLNNFNGFASLLLIIAIPCLICQFRKITR